MIRANLPPVASFPIVLVVVLVFGRFSVIWPFGLTLLFNELSEGKGGGFQVKHRSRASLTRNILMRVSYASMKLR
jgi:hypothetical protein